MEKVILEVHEDQIDVELSACENARYLMQRLFGKFKDIGLEPMTMQKLAHIQSQTDIKDYILSEIIALHETVQPLHVLGMPVSKSKLKDLIDIPEISEIKKIKEGFDNQTVKAIGYLMFEGGLISLKSGYEEEIREKYTVYTENPRQVEIVKKLTVLRDALNDWMDSCNVTNNNSLPFIDGLVDGVPQGRYSLDVAYIQRR